MFDRYELQCGTLPGDYNPLNQTKYFRIDTDVKKRLKDFAMVDQLFKMSFLAKRIKSWSVDDEKMSSV